MTFRYADHKEIIKDFSQKDLSKVSITEDKLLAFLYQSDVSEATRKVIENFSKMNPDFRIKNYFITKKQTFRYINSIPQYFTKEEALVIAINLMFHAPNCGLIKKGKHLEFLEHAESEPGVTKDLARTTTGLNHFDRAVTSRDNVEKKALLLESISYNFETIKSGKLSLLTASQIGFCYVLLEEFEKAIHFLLHSAKILADSEILYKVIGDIYKKIGMKNVQIFYYNKFEKINSTKRIAV